MNIIEQLEAEHIAELKKTFPSSPLAIPSVYK